METERQHDAEAAGDGALQGDGARAQGEGAETAAQWERLLTHVAPNASASQRSSRTVFVRAVSGPTPQALARAAVKADAAADALVGEMLQELKRRIEFKRRARMMRGDTDGGGGSGGGDAPLSMSSSGGDSGHNRDDSSGSEASSFSTTLSSPRAGPYFDFALAVRAMRLTSRWTPGGSREPSIHGGGAFGRRPPTMRSRRRHADRLVGQRTTTPRLAAVAAAAYRSRSRQTGLASARRQRRGTIRVRARPTLAGWCVCVVTHHQDDKRGA